MRMRHFAVIIAIALLAAGCQGASTSSPTDSPTISPTQTQLGCTTLAPPTMLYPVPSSTAVQTDGIYVGYESLSTLLSAWTPPTLTANGSATITGGPWLAPSPSPTNPPGNPLPSGDVYGVSSVSGLTSGAAYTVNVTNIACNNSFSLGTFTAK